MALSIKQRMELRRVMVQLRDGVISATDASKTACEVVFHDRPKFPGTTDEIQVWRKYDEAITQATMAMMKELEKLPTM